MPYLLGIDEAGYGPNLGPFVMSMVVVRVGEWPAPQDLWKVLKSAVRRAAGRADERLVIDDSKRVYSPGEGVAGLERTLWTVLWRSVNRPCSLEDHWPTYARTHLDQLVAEPWYEPGLPLPFHPAADGHDEVERKFQRACAKSGVEFCSFASVAIFPRQFNQLVAEHDSKAAAPAWALAQLLGELPEQLLAEPVRVHVDKLGGRNHYQPLLQGIFPDHFVLSCTEGAADSTYRLCGSACDMEVSFQPEADSRHLPVALASMLSKYSREVLMEMFNRFWRQHVPELKPTAGYPGDSRRFWEDIRPAREKLGIADEVLWRVR